MGSGTTLVTSNGTVGYSSGTSFSSPVLAGMGACLLQANPYAGVKMAKMAIEQSANQYDQTRFISWIMEFLILKKPTNT